MEGAPTPSSSSDDEMVNPYEGYITLEDADDVVVSAEIDDEAFPIDDDVPREFDEASQQHSDAAAVNMFSKFLPKRQVEHVLSREVGGGDEAPVVDGTMGGFDFSKVDMVTVQKVASQIKLKALEKK